MKKVFLSILLQALPLLANAYDCQVDGIYYNIVPGAGVAVVTYQMQIEIDKYQSDYTGSINIPEKFIFDGVEYTVTSISEYAFQHCNSLTSVTIPSSVTSIGHCAFDGCSGLTSVTIPNSVTSIGYSAFLLCSGLISVTIPDSVTAIGSSTFHGCTSLTSVTIPNSVTSIGHAAFIDCCGLTSVTIPNSVTTIGVNAFYGCSSLTSVTIPNSVTSIGEAAFSGCIGLNSINVENGNQYYDSRNNCNAIIETKTNMLIAGCMNTIIPNTVTSIGFEAFYGCSDLTSVTIPNSVTSIGRYAFSYCSGLTSITIPNSVNSIGNGAFCGCSSLTSVISKMENPCSIDEYCFSIPDEIYDWISYDDVYNNATLYVPKGTKDKYKSTDYWSKFLHIIEGFPFEHTLTYLVDGEIYSTYILEEGDEITPEESPTKEGYSFSGWSEIPEKMPASDLTITGTFVPNKYKLTYFVDGGEYKSSEVVFGSAITAEAVPTKEGYTFSGWSEIPETMPASDVTITGSFAINKYKLTYTLDGEEYKTAEVDYGTALTPEEAPVKEGYTFSGWSEIPETMPANDVTVTGTFTANKYKLTYMVDGEEYKASEVDYGTAITAEAVPTKEGYTFSGWSEIPSTMPAEDVTITGSFTVNKYTITYMVDDVVLMTEEVAYGSTIAPPKSQKDGYDILWSSHPTTMPAYDITIYGTYTTGISSLNVEESERQVFTPDGKRVETPKKGLNIIRMSDGTVKKVVVK